MTLTSSVIDLFSFFEREIMKLKKLFVFATSVLLLTGCGTAAASSSESAASSSSVVELDPIDQLIEDLKGNNLTVVNPEFASIEFYDDYSVFYDYESEYTTDSGVYYVPNVGYCDIDVNKNVTIDTPSDTKGKMSELYLMPSTVGELMERIGDRAFDDPVDDTYNVKSEDLIVYLGMLVGYDYQFAMGFSKATVTPLESSYQIYIFKDNSADRQSWNLTEEQYPDFEITCTISKIGTTTPNELADFAETYVPTGLSEGLSADDISVMKKYQGDDDIIDKIATLDFTASAFFEDAYLTQYTEEWHIMDYRIGDISNDYKKLLSDNGYEITLDNSEADVGNYTYIFEKANKATDETTSETWTSSVSRLTYAYVSHEWFTSKDGMGYPSWSYPDGRVGLAGLSDSYMQPSVCKSSWNEQKDVSGSSIPQFAPSNSIDKTKFVDDWGMMTFSMHFDDNALIVTEGKAYDKVLEDAGWTSEDGWAVYSETYAESIRQSTPDEDGKYTQITITATQTELDLSIAEVDPNASYDF